MRSLQRAWVVLLAAAFVASVAIVRLAGQTASLPDRLADPEFWQLSADLSEPNGQFQSDNLLSNEMVFERILPDLIARTKPGGVYLGVGPEQNFTYIAAMRPRMVFITDIRRGNLELQLMYKALFELSADRAEFLSRLFSKPRPAGLSARSTVRELINAYWDLPTAGEDVYAANLKAIDDELTKAHHLPLSKDDLDGIAGVYRAFYWYGPGMTYSANVALTGPTTGRGASYADLMLQSNAAGDGLSYLATEDKFAVLQELERRNMIVPVVGNFSGPKALRAVGQYVRDHGATVSAFYLSNVEMYLQRAGTWPDFCRNVATMPLDEQSVFIRPGHGNMVASAFVISSTNGSRIVTFNPTAPGAQGNSLVPMAGEVQNCGGPAAR